MLLIEVVGYDDGHCVLAVDRTVKRIFNEDLVRGFREDFDYRAWLERHPRTRKPDVGIVFTRRHHV